MRKIKDVLRLKLDAQLSHRQIAAALGISKAAVTKYLGLAAAAGLDWAAVQGVDEGTLERRLLAAPERPRDHVQPDYGRLHLELRRKGMTLMLLWEEHRADYADRQTYGYTQFCENYRRFAKQLKRSMRQVHRAGEKLFIDYAGPTIGLTDGSRAHIFVATLGASSYTFACATPRETMKDWLESTARALAFIGGVPQLIVPDKPKAMIADANRYEPRSNDTVLDFARHYGTSILPARPRHPQDKAKAESAVQIVERWIMARLRHQQFGSVHEVNQAMAPLLTRLNEKLFQKLPGSRASTFAEIDAPALLPLPLQRYEMAHFKTVKVHIDYHVEVERHRYSVPHSLVGQVLEARITTAVVELMGAADHQPCPQQPPGRLHHDGRAHAGRPSRQHGMDANPADPLGTKHRPGHGRSGDAADGREQASRARLPGLPWSALAGQALRQGEAGGGLHAGPADRRLPVPPRARHPHQQRRPERAGYRWRVGQP